MKHFSKFKKPNISIIIPTRNEGKYLEKTLKQYLPYKNRLNIEVIVSDAGSTDETLIIAKKYADKVIISKKNQKQNIAIGRNAGAKVAKGKIFFHTDADVIIPHGEEFFIKLNNIMKNKRIVAATTNLRIYPEEENFYDFMAHSLMNRFFSIFHLAKGECQIINSNAFLAVKGYNEKLVAGEDCDIFRRLKNQGKLVFLSDLKIFHSPRRFRKQGYIRLLMVFLTESIYFFFKKKSFLKEWKPQR